jgi:tight adherence protein B
VVAVAWAGGVLVAIATVVVLGVALALVSALLRSRAERAVDEALPVVVDRVAVAVRAGLSVTDGLRDGMQVVRGPVHADLHRIVSAVGAGAPLGRVLADWRRLRPSRGVRLVVAAITLGLEVGSRSRPLEGVAATLRSDLVAQAEIRGAAAQARAQAAVMIGAPALFVIANVARDPAGFGATFTRPVGAACLIGAIVLDGAGAWWMARLMRAAR